MGEGIGWSGLDEWMQGDFPKNSKDVATRLFYEMQAERRK